MRINGTETNIDSCRTLFELIESLGYSGNRIAVELNGYIIPRSDYDKVLLKDTDEIEIVKMVGGG